MRRHPAFHDLSRDHHDVLVHARRLRGLDARVAPGHAASAWRSYHEAVFRLHAAEEETILAPLLEALPDGAKVAARLREEHAAIARATAALGGSGEGAAGLGEALRVHVRFEEDELLPMLEGNVDGVALAVLGDELRAHRLAVRPLGCGTDRGEACFLGLTT